MYAIVRADLQMSPGKLAAQTGHAFLDTFDLCRKEYPDRAAEYHSGTHGTKVVLGVEDLSQLLKIYEQAKAAGLPTTLVVDSGHKMPPHFDGTPIETAVGIGPVLRHEIQHITGQLTLVR
jgi:PTH2 family peptidyl-tRNA hydrolase